MDIVTRAFMSISRNHNKALLLLIIIFILGIVVSGAISVQQAIENVDSNLRRALPPVVSVGVDHRAIQESINDTDEFPDIDIPSFEVYSQMGALPYVENYDISIGGSLLSKDLERVSSDEDIAISDFGMGNWMPMSLKGVYDSSLVDIEEGIIEIVSGRSFSEQEATTLSYVALISESFAEHNNLHIGSIFTLYNVVWDTRGIIYTEPEFYVEDNIYIQRSYDFEVVGIFSTKAQFNTGDEWSDMSMLDEHLNRIYVPNSITMAAHIYHIEHQAYLEMDNEWIQGSPEDSLLVSSVYILNSSAAIEDFRHAAESMLPEFWTVVDVSNSLENIISPMESIRGIAIVLLWIAIGASVIILSLLITLSARERKREIGIYLALGESKGRVVLQVMIEVLTIAAVAVVLSLLLGSVLAGSMSEVMLRHDMATLQNNDGDGMRTFTQLDVMGFGYFGISTEDVLADYNVSLSFETVGLFFAFAMGTVIAATTIPILYIIRLNPRKILM